MCLIMAKHEKVEKLKIQTPSSIVHYYAHNISSSDLNFQFLAPKITNFCIAIIPDVIPVNSAENVSCPWEWWIFVENLAKSIGENSPSWNFD